MIWKLPDAVLDDLLARSEQRLAAGVSMKESSAIWYREMDEAIKLHGIPAPFGEPEQRELTL